MKKYLEALQSTIFDFEKEMQIIQSNVDTLNTSNNWSYGMTDDHRDWEEGNRAIENIQWAMRKIATNGAPEQIKQMIDYWTSVAPSYSYHNFKKMAQHQIDYALRKKAEEAERNKKIQEREAYLKSIGRR
jgi:hypothetical protein